MAERDLGFFVGYLPPPRRLAGFLLVMCLSLVAGFAGAALVTGLSQDDPGDGGFRFDLGRQTVTGILYQAPYPVLHVTAGNEHIPEGHVLMLSGIGKNGVMSRAESFSGGVVTASGVLLQRGDLDMLQVRGGEDGLGLASDLPPELPLVIRDLGRWRVTGEICDGKCYAGAMRPGQGLAHKACANLCIDGGIPPVLVTSEPVRGYSFFLLGDSLGRALPGGIGDMVGIIRSVEGEIELRGDLPVFKLTLDMPGAGP